MARECGNQSDMEDILFDLAAMGAEEIFFIAETCILSDYWRMQMVPTTALFPGMSPEGTCVFEDPSIDSSRRFIEYLGRCNPVLDLDLLTAMINKKGLGVQVPDFMMHRPIDSTFEFYEIKPNSRSGRSKGEQKLAKIWLNMRVNALTAKYDLGVKYSRRGEAPFVTITKGFLLAEVTLVWEPGAVGGLILYKICIERKLRAAQVAEQAATNIVKASAVLAAILAEGGILTPLLAL